MNGITILRTCGGHENIRVIQKVIHNDELNQTIVIWRLFVVLLSISSHFSTRGSQVRCKLANYVSKFKNWARTSQQSSQVYFNVSTIVNKCSQFKLKLTIQLKVLGPVGYQEGLYFIELVIIIYMNIYLQTKFANFVAKFAPNFRTWKRNWQVRNELGNRALKSDLKSTIRSVVYTCNFCCDFLLLMDVNEWMS